MEFFKHFDWSIKSIAKLVGVVLLGLIVVTIVIALISFSFRTVFQSTSYERYPKAYPYPELATEEAFISRGLVAPSPPRPGFSIGEDAEAFEIKTYNSTIKTRKLEKTCEKIAGLKVREDVIFETSNQNDESCYFRFKVKKESEAEIADFIKDLKPDNFNENVQTIKGTLEAYDKQLTILEKKLTSIEDTLEKAQSAYDELTVLATRKEDVETLAIIIDNKLRLIEKLTNERIQIKGQIDRLEQNKADQLERLKFSFFNINVFKDKIFDWKEIKDSWKFELKAFVRNFNDVLQGISVSLLTFMLRFVQVAIYFFISVFLLKWVWMATRRIWKGKRQ